MIAALGEAVRILALPDTPVLRSLSPPNWPGGAKKQLLPLLIIDYWPASAESSVRSFYIRPDSGSSPCADSRCRVGGGGLFAGRQTALCLCFADVCWNALLEESLVIHGCSEGEDLPHYGPVLSMRIKVPLKSWLKNTPLLACAGQITTNMLEWRVSTPYRRLLYSCNTMCDCLSRFKPR